MNAQLAALALVIAEKELALGQLRGELQQATATIAERDATIAELEADLALSRAFAGDEVTA